MILPNVRGVTDNIGLADVANTETLVISLFAVILSIFLAIDDYRYLISSVLKHRRC